MNTKDIVRQNGETTSPIIKNTADYTDTFPSMPSLYREMTNWMQEWDNLLAGFFGPRWNWTTGPSTRTNGIRFTPAIDIREGDNGYVVTAELPGIAPKEVEITVQENTLLIKGEKKSESESKGEGYHRMERSYGSFRRAITLPKGIDVEHIDARFDNGVLTLTLPKLPEAKAQARKIEIKSPTPAGESTEQK